MRPLRDLIQRIGVLDAVLFLAARALERVTGGRARFFKYYFMAQPVPRAARPSARATGIVVEEVQEGDPRLEQFERPAAELARRFATSSRCFAAWQGTTLTGFLWFTDDRYDEDEVRCTFRVNPADRAVWDLDVHVMPRFRLGRTFALLWENAFAAMRARGARWTISRVSAFNADSIRAHQRLGARRTGWAVFLLFGSFQFTLTSLGQLKCGRQEHGPYPVIDARAPCNTVSASEPVPADEEGLVPRGASNDGERRLYP
ncbi:MAG: N-acetyltransferase family protein [Burkholderiaceae bacterium]